MILEESLVGNPLVQIVWQRLQISRTIGPARRARYFNLTGRLSGLACAILITVLLFALCLLLLQWRFGGHNVLVSPYLAAPLLIVFFVPKE